MSALNRISLAPHAAVTSQDWWKVPFTAGQNVMIGRHDRDGSRPSIVDAATAATAHEMIEKLPFGYDTKLNRQFKKGHDLSGGEWQRLISARSYYGTHDALMAAGSLYRELFELQASGYLATRQ